MLKIYIENNGKFKNKVLWVLTLLRANYDILFTLSDLYNCDISIGVRNGCTILLSDTFYSKIENKVFDHGIHMVDGPYIKNHLNEIDFISSIFYLVNGIQEYHSTDIDKFGRFTFQHSLQKKWNIIQENTVHTLIIQFLEKYKIPFTFNSSPKIILSHDIDFVNEGWKADLIWSLKQLNILTGIKIISDRWFGKGVYNNVMEIAKFEHSVGFSSIFFWIPFRGKCKSNINNADYNILSKSIKKSIAETKKLDSFHGLHKSSLENDFDFELLNLGFETKSNRYHYLKYSIPEGFDQLEKSKIRFDFSLGFPDQVGFRNSFGLPFIPFNLKEDKPYNFLVVPLNIMDRTLTKYTTMTTAQMETFILKWIENVKNHSLITILWHNVYYVNYARQDMKLLYNNLLLSLSEKNFKTCNTDDLNDLMNRWTMAHEIR